MTLTKSHLWTSVYLLKVFSSCKTWNPLSLLVTNVSLTTAVCSRLSKTNGTWRHTANFRDLPWTQRSVEIKGPTSQLRDKVNCKCQIGPKLIRLQWKTKTRPESSWFPLTLPEELGLQAWIFKTCRTACERQRSATEGYLAPRWACRPRGIVVTWGRLVLVFWPSSWKEI